MTMNLSSSNKQIAGETLTITCYTCGMPSSKEWAQKVRSRLSTSLRPYYPFLLQLQSPNGAALREDGSTFVCAFCHASLEAQWKSYERLPTPAPPMNRKYNLYRFICAVCGVETYRKRVRTLPFQEFPFLANQRAPGSLTLGNNPLAVVCLDCSETLWAQSAEYDRWGLPVHKRHFNWMARPPPPEDSVEATVARLPSGETQLPRCPPIEPVLITKPKCDVPTYEHHPRSSSRIRSSKSESKSETTSSTPVRKTSLASSSGSNPNLDTGSHSSQPPVVTVAPMSAHSTTLSSLRKETLSVPPNLSSGYPKYDCGLQPPQLGPPPMFPRSPMFSPASYSHFHWAGREGSLNDHYSYGTLDGLQQTPTNTSWSWLPPPSYQPFMPSSFNRSYALNEPYYNASHSYYPPSPETNMSSVSTNASSSYNLPSFSLQQNSGRSSPTYVSQVSSTPNSTDHSASIISQRQSSSVSSNEQETHVRKVSSSDGKSSSVRSTVQDSIQRKVNHVKVSSTKGSSDSSIRGTIPKKSFSKMESNATTTTAPVKTGKELSFKSSTANLGGSDTLPTNFKPKSNAIRKHNKERLMNSGQWKSSSLSNNKNNHMMSEDVPGGNKAEDNKKSGGGNEIKLKNPQCGKSQHSKSKHGSESEPMDFSLSEKKTKVENDEYNVTRKVSSSIEDGGDSGSIHPLPMDLSLPSNVKISTTASTTNPRNVSSSSTNFMIAYLCRSESTASSQEKEINHDNSSSPLPPPQSSEIEEVLNSKSVVDLKTRVDGDLTTEPSGRRSVIVTLPKSENSEDGEMENSSLQVPLKSLADDNNTPPLLSESTENIHTATDESEKTCDENMTDNKGNSDDHEMLHVQVTQINEVTVKNELKILSSPDLNKVKVEMDHSTTTGMVVPEDCCKINNQSESAQEIVKKIINEHKQESRNARILKRKLEADQEEFLSALGLITPRKKSELELDILIRRSQHHTLPPLKLRPSTPPKSELSNEFEKKLLQIAFDDPSSTRQNDLNEEEVSFLAHLGLKPASKQEKTKRENEWRYVTAERMMREKRGKHLVQGDKTPWFSGSSKLLTPLIKSPTESSSEVLGSLSLTLPSQMEFSSSTGNPGSSDLLTIASSHNTSKTESITVSAMCIVQPVISYPKYVPSYAVSVPPTNSCASNSDDAGRSPPPAATSGPSSSPCGSLEKVSTNLLNAVDDVSQSKETVQTTCNHSSLEDTRILKVPVISATTNSTEEEVLANSPSTDNESDTATIVLKETLGVKNATSSVINAIIQADVINFQNFETEINNLLNGISTSPNCKTDDTVCQWPGSLSDWRNLKNHLKSRQSKVKAIEESLKKREKQILKQLRARTKNTE